MKKYFKSFKKLMILITLITGTVILSAGGGGGGGKGPNNCKTCPTPDPPCTLINCTLILPFDFNVQNISGRNWDGFQPSQNILNGGQIASTPNLATNPHLNYCKITITSTDCIGYGNSNVKTYLWDSSNNGNNPGMNIEIPDGPFILSVEIHESCGMYYSQYPYTRRAKFVHTGTHTPNSAIILQPSNFLFINAPQCYL